MYNGTGNHQANPGNPRNESAVLKRTNLNTRCKHFSINAAYNQIN